MTYTQHAHPENWLYFLHIVTQMVRYVCQTGKKVCQNMHSTLLMCLDFIFEGGGGGGQIGLPNINFHTTCMQTMPIFVSYVSQKLSACACVFISNSHPALSQFYIHKLHCRNWNDVFFVQPSCGTLFHLGCSPPPPHTLFSTPTQPQPSKFLQTHTRTHTHTCSYLCTHSLQHTQEATMTSHHIPPQITILS